MLLTLDNIRDHEDLKNYVDAKSDRALLLVDLKRTIEANPVFKDKLVFPSLKDSHLRTLINQSLNGQNQLTGSKPSDLRSLHLPDDLSTGRAPIARLLYTNSGDSLLALSFNTSHELWRWKTNKSNVAGKATADVVPQQVIPSGQVMRNSAPNVNPRIIDPCFALSKNSSFLVSASGGAISLFNMKSFAGLHTLMPPPPAANYIAFLKDNNTIAIGMDDSTIQIYNIPRQERLSKLQGHQKRVTGLAFSIFLDVLVSSGADLQLCVWSFSGWEKIISKFLQMPTAAAPYPNSPTRIQFHEDGIHVLAVHESQIAVYEAPKMEAFKQWFPRESSRAIRDAVYSGGCQMIYVCFKNGWLGVLIAKTLTLGCMINPAAYLLRNPRGRVYPVVIAANPTEPNQFALGLTDGGVHILEPLKSREKWFTLPPGDGAGSSRSSAFG